MARAKLPLSFRNLDLPKAQGDAAKTEVLYYPTQKGEAYTNRIELTVTNDTKFAGKIPAKAGFVFDFSKLPIVDLSGVQMAAEGGDWTCEGDKANQTLTLRYQGDALEWAKGEPLSWTLLLPAQAPATDHDITGTIIQKDLTHFDTLKDKLPRKNVKRASNKITIAYLREPGTKVQHLLLHRRFLPNANGTLGNVVWISEAGGDEIKNQFSFQLENRSREAVKGGQLSVLIAAGDAYYDLAPGDTLAKFKLREILREGESSELLPPDQPEYNHDSGVVSWTFHPRDKDGAWLGVGGPHALNLALSEVVTYLPVGAAEITLLLMGMDDYEDCAIFLKVDKLMPTPRILDDSFQCINEDDQVAPQGPAKLIWQTIGLDDLKLTYTLGGKTTTLTHSTEGLPLNCTSAHPFPLQPAMTSQPWPEGKRNVRVTLTPKIAGQWREEGEPTFFDVKALKPIITIKECRFIDDNKHLLLDYEFEHAEEMIIASSLLYGGERTQKLNKPENPVTLDILEDEIDVWEDHAVFKFVAKNTTGKTLKEQTTLLKPVIERFDMNYTPANKLEITYKVKYITEHSKVWLSFSYNKNWTHIYFDIDPSKKSADGYQGTYELDVMQQEGLKAIWEQDGTLSSINIPINLSAMNVVDDRQSATDVQWYVDNGRITLYRTPELEGLDFGYSRWVHSPLRNYQWFSLHFSAQYASNLQVRDDKGNALTINPEELTKADFSYEGNKKFDMGENGFFYGLVNNSAQADFTLQLKATNGKVTKEQTLYFNKATVVSHGGRSEANPQFGPEPVKQITIGSQDDYIRFLMLNDRLYGGKASYSSYMKLGKGEYITEVAVTDAWDGSVLLVTHLKISTNKGDTMKQGSTTFGDRSSTKRFPGKILAIGGRSGNAIDQIIVVYV